MLLTELQRLRLASAPCLTQSLRKTVSPLPYLLSGDVDLFQFAVCFSSFQSFLEEEKEKEIQSISVQRKPNKAKGRGKQVAPGPASRPALPLPAEYTDLWFSTCNKTGLCLQVTSRVAKTNSEQRMRRHPILGPGSCMAITSPSPIHLQSPGGCH